MLAFRFSSIPACSFIYVHLMFSLFLPVPGGALGAESQGDGVFLYFVFSFNDSIALSLLGYGHSNRTCSIMLMCEFYRGPVSI